MREDPAPISAIIQKLAKTPRAVKQNIPTIESRLCKSKLIALSTPQRSLTMPLGVHDHPFYKPKWRRQAIVATTAIWSVFELLIAKDGFWSVIAIAVWGYSFWTFIWTWKDTPPET
jgi:hypothetical protein